MKMLIKTIFSVVSVLALLPFAPLAGQHEGGVEMSKLDNIRLGDTVVVVFTEDLVLSLKEI
tara:strand:- start:379 stop:561 length:183 start_codon:yes stop_codon:yes gene_type:complete